MAGNGGKLLQHAKTAIEEAIAADHNGDIKLAYAKYQTALERFLLAMKYEKNPATIEAVKVKVSGYMDRAEKVAIKESDGRKVTDQKNGGSGGEMNKLIKDLELKILEDKPNVNWEDVAGLASAKRTLQECVLLPARFPTKFQGIRKPWKGILLYGPPGTGKSFLAKALATEADSTFITVDSAAIMSKWQGESPKQVSALFQLASRHSPSVIFIDEIDSLVGARGDNDGAGISQVKTQFMIETQSVGKDEKMQGVLLLGATNLPWNLDVAILRRFEKRVYVPLPDKEARMALLKNKLSKLPNGFSQKDFDTFVKLCDGYSGSDIEVVIKEAVYQPMRECHQAEFFRVDEDGCYMPVLKPCSKCPVKKTTGDCVECGALRMSVFDVPSDKLNEPDVNVDHVMNALKRINPAAGKDVLQKYNDWTKSFGEFGTTL